MRHWYEWCSYPQPWSYSGTGTGGSLLGSSASHLASTLSQARPTQRPDPYRNHPNPSGLEPDDTTLAADMTKTRGSTGPRSEIGATVDRCGIEARRWGICEVRRYYLEPF